jgi:hypothetical protein
MHAELAGRFFQGSAFDSAFENAVLTGLCFSHATAAHCESSSEMPSLAVRCFVASGFRGRAGAIQPSI